MAFLSKEEYLRLIESARLDEEGYDELDYHAPEAWIPAVSPAKEKMERARAISNHGVIDILNHRKDQIKDALHKNINFRIGEFTIHIRKYKQTGDLLSLDIFVMQQKYQTPSGSPCNMSYKADLFRDNRFINKPWLAYFDSSGRGKDIPIETMVDIVRWLQALNRMNSFL